MSKTSGKMKNKIIENPINNQIKTFISLSKLDIHPFRATKIIIASTKDTKL